MLCFILKEKWHTCSAFLQILLLWVKVIKNAVLVSTVHKIKFRSAGSEITLPVLWDLLKISYLLLFSFKLLFCRRETIIAPALQGLMFSKCEVYVVWLLLPCYDDTLVVNSKFSILMLLTIQND